MGKRRQLSLTARLVAAVDRTEPRSEPESGLVPLSDEDYRQTTLRLLAECGEGPFLVFAYGSLIWKPTFSPASEQRGRAHGWRRSFCLDIENWRATPDQPGLMMALEQGGCCDGLLLELPRERIAETLEGLLRREAAYHEDLVYFRWIPVRTGRQKRRAYVFYAAPRKANYVIHLPIHDQAYRIARAAGFLGSNAAYLHNTIVKLQEHGITDSYLWKLQELVAAEIHKLHPGLEA